MARALPLVAPHLDRAIDELVDAIATCRLSAVSSPQQRPSVSTEIQSRVLKSRTLRLSCREISINAIANRVAELFSRKPRSVGSPDTEYSGTSYSGPH